MDYLVVFLVGCICGIVFKDLLPADVINHYENYLKIKKSTVQQSDINQTTLFPEQTKKPGLLKRIFKRKQLKNETIRNT